MDKNGLVEIETEDTIYRINLIQIIVKDTDCYRTYK